MGSTDRWSTQIVRFRRSRQVSTEMRGVVVVGTHHIVLDPVHARIDWSIGLVGEVVLNPDDLHDASLFECPARDLLRERTVYNIYLLIAPLRLHFHPKEPIGEDLRTPRHRNPRIIPCLQC